MRPHWKAEPFWTTFLRDLAKRGLKGVKLVISDAHEGLKNAITRVVGATWQRCRVGLLKKSLLRKTIRPPDLFGTCRRPSGGVAWRTASTGRPEATEQ